jgi:hypothetical protein
VLTSPKMGEVEASGSSAMAAAPETLAVAPAGDTRSWR